MRNLRCREGKPLSRVTQRVLSLSKEWPCVLPYSLLSESTYNQRVLHGRGEAGSKETIHQFHFPLDTEQPCRLVITNVQNVKWWWIVCQFSYLSWHRGGFVGEFHGVRILLFIHCTSSNCSHRDSGKDAHINSHKLPLQNVKIKSGFLFWGYAQRMLTPSGWWRCHHQKNTVASF